MLLLLLPKHHAPTAQAVHLLQRTVAGRAAKDAAAKVLGLQSQDQAGEGGDETDRTSSESEIDQDEDYH